jgi:hypothetical protein
MDWTQLVGELKGLEYTRGVVTPTTKPFRISFAAGLTDAEVARIERDHGFRFPPDLREFLRTALPVGDGFPDWRNGDVTSLEPWLGWPKHGILFDVEHAGFWLEDWGVRPDSIAQAKDLAATFIDAAPRLIPVYSHRMLPSEPHLVGNPVFSVYQTDIIHYGFDLEDYLRHEFKLPGRRPWPEHERTIEFWSKLL